MVPNGKIADDVNNKIGQSKHAIRQINNILWEGALTRETKNVINKTIFESVVAEVQVLNKRQKGEV